MYDMLTCVPRCWYDVRAVCDMCVLYDVGMRWCMLYVACVLYVMCVSCATCAVCVCCMYCMYHVLCAWYALCVYNNECWCMRVVVCGWCV